MPMINLTLRSSLVLIKLVKTYSTTEWSHPTYVSLVRVQSNGGTLLVNLRSEMPGYKIKTWFGNKAITKIVSLNNVIKQYRGTYDSGNKQFFVHRQDSGLPNMVFQMHSSGIHLYDSKEHGE